MQVLLVVKSLQASDDFCQDLDGFVERKHLILEPGLIIDKISSITILQTKIIEILVLMNVVEFDNVGRVHIFHALDLAIQVFLQMGLLLDHSIGN